MDFPSDFLPVSAITDGSVLRLPRQEVSAIIKQELTNDDVESLRQIVQKCLDRNDDWAKKVEEIVISSTRFRDYVGALDADDERGLGLVPGVLDGMTLEAILGRVGGDAHGKLKTFTWCLNKPIPTAVLAKLQAEFSNVTLRVLKRQMTDDAVDVPNLDIPFWTAVANPQVQIHRNDFGVFLWSTHPARSLKLHLLVPYYPASKEARPLWMSRKSEVAIDTIMSLPQLESTEVSDHQGEISLLLPAIVTQAETLRVLKMHTIPGGIMRPPVRPSWLTPEQIEAMAEKLLRLEELEMDFPFLTVYDDNEDWTKKGKELLEMPFTAPRGDTAALGRFKSLKTLRLWIEVPLQESVFQEKFQGKEDMPPLKEDAMCEATRNLYSLLRLEREKNELGRDFETVLELNFTRVDSFDRQGCYPKFLPVTARAREGGEDVSVEVGEWKDDYPGEDVYKFIQEVVGFIY